MKVRPPKIRRVSGYEIDEALDEVLPSEIQTILPVYGRGRTKGIAKNLLGKLRSYKTMKGVEVEKPTREVSRLVSERVKAREGCCILGIGGGKNLDVAKYIGSLAKKPVVLFPTQLSHDGIASNRATLRDGEAIYSLPTQPPLAVILSEQIIYDAPLKSYKLGFADCVAKISSTKDYELRGTYGGDWVRDPPYSERIARACLEEAKKIFELAKLTKSEGEFSKANPLFGRFVEGLTQALVLFGSFMCELNSSVACSGFEHNYAHALGDVREHGFKVALGQKLSLTLYEDVGFRLPISQTELIKIQTYFGIPQKVEEIGKTKTEAIRAVPKAYEILRERGRYTILSYCEEQLGMRINERFARAYVQKAKLLNLNH